LQNLKSIIDTVIANFETMLANRDDKMTAFENVEESILDLLTKIQAAQPIQSPPDPVIPAARQITPGKISSLTNTISDSKDKMTNALAQLRMKLGNIKMLAATVNGLIQEADRIAKTGYETKAEADEVARVFKASINTQISALNTALNQQRSQFNQQLNTFNLAYNTARAKISLFLNDAYFIIRACQRAGRISGITGRQDVVDQYWKTKADYNALPR
jgi:HAMP domain-containing protein